MSRPIPHLFRRLITWRRELVDITVILGVAFVTLALEIDVDEPIRVSFMGFRRDVVDIAVICWVPFGTLAVGIDIDERHREMIIRWWRELVDIAVVYWVPTVTRALEIDIIDSLGERIIGLRRELVDVTVIWRVTLVVGRFEIALNGNLSERLIIGLGVGIAHGVVAACRHKSLRMGIDVPGVWKVTLQPIMRSGAHGCRESARTHLDTGWESLVGTSPSLGAVHLVTRVGPRVVFHRSAGRKTPDCGWPW